MLGTAPVEPLAKTLQVGVGFATHEDAIWAAVRATAMARAGLQGAAAEMVLLVTAGVPSQDTLPMIRSVLGPVGVAGGATAAILTHNGAVGNGALVVCLANGDGAVSGVAASSGRDLADAAQGAARLILAGWPFRMRYPRGLGLAFCRPGVGAPAESFLASWRLLMGPKMRTVCSVLSRSEEHTSELQSPCNLVCRLLLEKKKKTSNLKHHPPTLPGSHHFSHTLSFHPTTR